MKTLASGIPSLDTASYSVWNNNVIKTKLNQNILNLDDTSGQLKLEGWLYNFFIFYIFSLRRHHFYRQFGRTGTNYQLIDYLRDEASFRLLGRFGWRLDIFFFP